MGQIFIEHLLGVMHLLDSLHRYFISLHFDHIIPIFEVKKKLAKATNFPKVTQLLAGRDSNPGLYGFKANSFFC